LAVKIRLTRKGRKKRPFYRIVVADSRFPRDGRYIENIGTYNPITEPPQVAVAEDRVHYWLDNGALPTQTVRSLLKKEGILHKRYLLRRGVDETRLAEEMKKWEVLQLERRRKAESEPEKKARAKVKAPEEKEAEEAVPAAEAVEQAEPAPEKSQEEAAAPEASAGEPAEGAVPAADAGEQAEPALEKSQEEAAAPEASAGEPAEAGEQAVPAQEPQGEEAPSGTSEEKPGEASSA